METLLLVFVELLVCFGGVVLAERFLGKAGVIAWVSFGTIVANIQIFKQIEVPIVGITTMGCVMFASIFLACDIVNEKYGEDDAKDVVKTLALVNIAMFVVGNLTKLIPAFGAGDTTCAVDTIFSYAPFATLVSTLCMLAASYLDIKIFNFIKRQFPKQLWLRNNVSTLITNLSENIFIIALVIGPAIGLTFAGFWPLLAIKCATEALCALLDTPFLYIAKYWK